MRILFAADPAGDVRILREMLLNDGHELVPARTGEAVVQALKATDAPALAILDARLPDVVAAEVCRELRANAAAGRPYILALSNQGGTTELVEILDAGADQLLTRPMEAEEMLARTRAALRMAQHLVDLRQELRAMLSTTQAPLLAQTGTDGKVVSVSAGGTPVPSALNLQDILTTLLPLAELETIVGQTLADMGLGDPTPVADSAIEASFRPSIGVVHFMIMPEKAAWLDLLLETDTKSANALYEVFTGMSPGGVSAADLVDVIGETLNMIQGALKATFKSRGTELLVPLVPQSISPEKVAGRVVQSAIQSRHVYQMPGICLRFTLYANFSPIQRKPLRDLGLASVLAEPLRPIDNNDLVLMNKGTLLNHRALKKVENLAAFAPNTLHPVIAPSPLLELLSID